MSDEMHCTCGHCGHEFDAVPEGGHVLLCGDARDFSDVTRLFAGNQANVVITSPPYASQRTYDASSGFKPIRPDAYVDWFRDVAVNVMAVLADDGSYFLNIKEHCDDGQRSLYVKDLTIAHVREWGWRFVDEFCWVRSGVPGGWNNRFKNAWEPVFHFARTDGIKFRPEAVSHRSEKVLTYSRNTPKAPSGLLQWNPDVYKPGMARPSNVLDLPSGGSLVIAEQTAGFPVDLPAFFINAFSDPGNIVYDPFMGSGTTLIAAERTGRIAYGMEISPAYCDVIVRRWEQLTGRTATRMETADAAA
jgi:site-specific DNA-methyltransferase (adenine-specific)